MCAVCRGGIEHVEDSVNNNPMKKTSKLFGLAIVLAVGMSIGLLEMFDLHPQFSVGNVHSYWVGVRKMDLQSSGPMTIALTDGRKEIYKEHNFGLIKVVSIQVM